MLGSKKAGSRIVSMTLEEMEAARQRGESFTDWERVRRNLEADPQALAENRAIGELVAKLQARRLD